MNIQTTQIAVHPIIATIEAKVFPSLFRALASETKGAVCVEGVDGCVSIGGER